MTVVFINLSQFFLLVLCSHQSEMAHYKFHSDEVASFFLVPSAVTIIIHDMFHFISFYFILF